MEGRDESGSAGTLLTDSSDISRRIRSNLLEGSSETNGGKLTSAKTTGEAMWDRSSESPLVENQDRYFTSSFVYD